MIKVPYLITRDFILKHPTWLFLYGDHYHQYDTRRAGQASTCRGLSNTYPIWTKWKFCELPTSYFCSRDYETLIQPILETCLRNCPIERYDAVVALPRIGEGGSELSKRCPEALKYIKKWIDKLQTKDIEWI